MLIGHMPETQQLHQTVINTLSEGIYMMDRDRNILVWNDAAERITGYSQDEMMGQHCAADVLDQIDDTGAPLCNHSCPIDATIQDGKQRIKELFFRHKRGYRIPVSFKVVPVLSDGEIVGALATFSDNSVQTHEEHLNSSLSRLVQIDQLTGLPNRNHTETVLESRLTQFKRNGAGYSILFINLDDFSQCNEDYGYETGNNMLIKIANAFRENLRGTDFIGRWKGEEFVGILETNSQNHLKHVTETIRQMIEATQIECYGNSIYITASIGATMMNGADNARQLVDRSISLMHVSKISGKNCVTIG